MTHPRSVFFIPIIHICLILKGVSLKLWNKDTPSFPKSTYTMSKILIATEKPFSPDAVGGIKDILQFAGYEVKLLESYTEKAQLLEAVADAAALIVRSDKIDDEVDA